MNWFLDILYYSASSILWGIFIGCALMALFFFLIKGWYKDAHFSVASYIVGALLGILLIFQCTLICGSIHIIRIANDFEPFVAECVANITESKYQIITPEESREVISELVEESPLLGKYVGGGVFEGYSASQLPHAIISELKSFMGYYILRRLLWCLFFVVAGAIIVIKSMSGRYKGRSKTQDRRRGYTVQRTNNSHRRRSSIRERSYR